MLIQRLELENIKSYRNAAFDFKEGVHFISGENGSGKTTLIEAIGFALFDVAPSKYDYFVRQGARRGTVRVRFLADDGREYLVERRCSTRRQECWSVLDTEYDTPVDLHGSSDALDFLRLALNAQTEHRLSELYREIIAIPQGSFTTPFLSSPAKRKETFNAILRVDTYRTAFDRTSGLDGRYHTRIEGFRTSLSILARETSVYDERVKERSRLNDELAGLRHELENARTRFAEADERLTALNRKREAVEEARRSALEARNVRNFAVQRRDAARARLSEAEEARRVCDANRDAFRAHGEALASEKTLQKRADARRTVAEALVRRERERDNDKTRLASLEEWLTERTTERDELVQRLVDEEESLKPLRADADAAVATTRHERLRIERALNGLAFLEDRARTLSNLNEVLDSEAVAIDALTQERESHRETLSDLEAVRSLAERVTTDRATRDDALARVNEIHALRKQAEKHRRDAKGGNCPILGEPCQNVGGDLERHFVKQLNLYDDELDAPTAALRHAENALNESEAAEKRLQTLEKAAALLASVEKQIADRQQAQHKARLGLTWDDWERSLKDAVEDVARSSADAAHVLRQEHQELMALRRAVAEEDDIESLRLRLPATVQRVRSVRERWLSLLSVAREKAQEAERDAVAAKAALEIRETTLASNREQLARIVKQVAADESDANRLRASLTEREAQIALKRDELATYDDVEPALNTVRETLEKTREGHARYQQFRRVAEAFDERRDDLDAAERLAAIAAERAEAAERTLAERETDYDDAERVRVESERDVAQRAVEGLTERVKSTDSNVSRLDDEIARLDERRREMATLEASIARTEKARALADFIRRRVLNVAGTRIASAYRERVSEYATTLYRRLSRENVELRWTADYNILLRGSAEGEARERLFEQLSGGEQMSAALAVRLALLRLLSGISLAIFDEPTTNLDAERRDRLAQSLPELRNVCRQLFVVSHDDAFDSVVDEVIRIEKTPDGGSRRVDV
jgi:exonuclease SbcC